MEQHLHSCGELVTPPYDQHARLRAHVFRLQTYALSTSSTMLEYVHFTLLRRPSSFAGHFFPLSFLMISPSLLSEGGVAAALFRLRRIVSNVPLSCTF
jgi:hypothetical protein